MGSLIRKILYIVKEINYRRKRIKEYKLRQRGWTQLFKAAGELTESNKEFIKNYLH